MRIIDHIRLLDQEYLLIESKRREIPEYSDAYLHISKSILFRSLAELKNCGVIFGYDIQRNFNNLFI